MNATATLKMNQTMPTATEKSIMLSQYTALAGMIGGIWFAQIASWGGMSLWWAILGCFVLGPMGTAFKLAATNHLPGRKRSAAALMAMTLLTIMVLTWLLEFHRTFATGRAVPEMGKLAYQQASYVLLLATGTALIAMMINSTCRGYLKSIGVQIK